MATRDRPPTRAVAPPTPRDAPPTRKRDVALLVGLGVIGILAPLLAPHIVTQLAFLWLMILFAVTWDINGGQMGYNSFGNVFFFGLGVYACALVQRDSGLAYYPALFVGTTLGGLVAALGALVLGPAILGIRGHYFAIATLGLSIVAADLASAWEYVGAASGMTVPVFPGEIADRSRFFYYSLFALAALTFLAARALYATRLGLAMNAIRDNEDKAEAMGLHTTRTKVFAWCVSAFFLGAAGGPVGNLVGFIDPRDLAFAGATFGVWMVLMAVLGGKGTLWGPVIGAVIFHVTQEVFWTYLLGWQRVAMGLLIVVIVVFFPTGVTGWFARMRRRTEPVVTSPAESAR
ncbi:MAG TPA: branched-chain amino acid ABC transporter permease [Casimicrobiaceae bacterium]|nr:branched-chain amino acid ABC transporter permease [Casimicrobiaceae bacterium]